MPTSVAPTAQAAVPSSPVSGHKKFSTFAGLRELSQRSSHGTSANSGSNRTSVRGLFDDDDNPSSLTASPKLHDAELDPVIADPASTLGRSTDGPWSISVAEAKDKREGRKRKQVVASFTLYVTTPTHNLTLIRTVNDIIELDSKLQDSPHKLL